MSFRLVAYNAMYADDAEKIVRPFVAARKIRESFTTPLVHIQGLTQHVSPFVNRELQVDKLVRDIEEGRVFLLDDSVGYGTLSGHLAGSSGFCSRVTALKSSGKKRAIAGCCYVDESPAVDLDKYTPEPIVEDEPDEQTEKTEFLCGWSESQRSQTKAQAIAALLPSKYQQEKRALLDRHNEHLGDNVREGEMIVIPTRDPKTDGEHEELNALKAEAQKVSTTLHSIDEEEARIAVRFFPLMDYIISKENYDGTLAVYGTVLAGVEAHLKSIEKTLKSINKLFCDEVTTVGSRKYLSSTFYSERAKLFKQLDSSLHRLTFNCVGIPVYKKLKNTLGLSIKSIVYYGKDILDASGVIKGFSLRLEAIAKWLKGCKQLGIVGVILSALGSIPVIVEAFTSKDGDPLKAVSVEAAGIYGGYLGGTMGAQAGIGLATFTVGVATSVASIFLGSVTAGPIVLGIAVIGGAAVGAYWGAKKGSEWFKEGASWLYDMGQKAWNQVDDFGGFFDWNATQP